MDTLQTSHTNKMEKCWYHNVCHLDYDCNACPRYLEMKYMLENCNLPKAKQKPIKLVTPECDKDAYKKLADIKADIYNFVHDGKSLYIGSKYTGNGKTSWAIKMMHSYFDAMWDGNGFKERALFVHVPTFIMMCKDFDSGSAEISYIKDRLNKVDLVVWDDIASTEMSAYDFSQILPFVDYRASLANLSNIFTSNYMNRDALTDAVGERLASRIWSNDAEVVLFYGSDLR